MKWLVVELAGMRVTASTSLHDDGALIKEDRSDVYTEYALLHHSAVNLAHRGTAPYHGEKIGFRLIQTYPLR